MQKLIIPILFAALLASCSEGTDKASTAKDSTIQSAGVTQTENPEAVVTDDTSNPNILQVALSSEDHTTLVAAVKAADQSTALTNNGPLTVFAPVNSAFEALPEGTVENLLKPENKMKLIEIIQFHAAPGSYDVNQLRDGQSLFVASGHNIKVEKKDGETFVHGAKIIGTVKAANGIIHVVDKVLLP